MEIASELEISNKTTKLVTKTTFGIGNLLEN